MTDELTSTAGSMGTSSSPCGWRVKDFIVFGGRADFWLNAASILPDLRGNEGQRGTGEAEGSTPRSKGLKGGVTGFRSVKGRMERQNGDSTDF